MLHVNDISNGCSPSVSSIFTRIKSVSDYAVLQNDLKLLEVWASICTLIRSTYSRYYRNLYCLS